MRKRLKYKNQPKIGYPKQIRKEKFFIFAGDKKKQSRGNSSVGRASASQAEGRGFESRFPLTKKAVLFRQLFLFYGVSRAIHWPL